MDTTDQASVIANALREWANMDTARSLAVIHYSKVTSGQAECFSWRSDPHPDLERESVIPPGHNPVPVMPNDRGGRLSRAVSFRHHRESRLGQGDFGSEDRLAATGGEASHTIDLGERPGLSWCEIGERSEVMQPGRGPVVRRLRSIRHCGNDQKTALPTFLIWD